MQFFNVSVGGEVGLQIKISLITGYITLLMVREMYARILMANFILCSLTLTLTTTKKDIPVNPLFCVPFPKIIELSAPTSRCCLQLEIIIP